MRVAILGLGTVGSAVARLLERNKEIIAKRAGKEIRVVVGVDRDTTKTATFAITTNFDDAFGDNVDVVVELMGGVEKPYEVVTRALKSGKHVVTANKALLAYHRFELEALAGDLAFEYEASVAGGIPIINALRDGLSANNILSIMGILNGTTNYILTQMFEYGTSYEVALAAAQKLGYAEANPTFDVGGFDAAHKLLVLASIAYGIDAKPEDIFIEGIEGITSADIEFAKEFDYKIKLLAIAKKDGDQIELRVHPAMISKDKMIAKVDDVKNGISVVGDAVGETMYYGAGAGGDATASAVVANLIEIARNPKKTPMFGYVDKTKTLTLKPIESIESRYYLRIGVEDKAGVLAKIATILGEHNISIESMLQKTNADVATLFLTTHMTIERDIQAAIAKINALPSTKIKTYMIGIED